MLLTVRNLSKMYGPRLLFSGITLGLAEGQRIGLIGANGSGKSTLLKVFAGVEQPDDGAIESKRGLIVGYVPQRDTFSAALTVLDLLVEAVHDAHDNHEREMKAEILLDKVGFKDPHQPVGALSGGWRKRLAIARELAHDPELLLMDEPTNHLDLDGIEWLEDLIGSSSFATLTVSHDRRFLEESVTRIIELSRQYPDGFLSHDGTYSEFVEKRAEFLEAQAGREQALASTVRREIEWLRQGAKARTTKAKGRIERAGDMMAELAQLKQRNTKQGAAGLDFTASERQTRKLIEVKGVTKALGGRTLFKNVSAVIGPGTRLGLLGPNGSGKSTLIKVLTGKLEPDAGQINRAENLKVVIFDQHREALDQTQTLRRALSPAGDTLQFQGNQMHISAWARKFLFSTQALDMPVSELSGGEQSRVLIARLMLSPADVLVLDEPTNDLDIPTLDVLEQSLEEFNGAVVMVTHDRYLLDRISTDLLALDINGDDSGAWANFAELAQWERARDERVRAQAQAEQEALDAAKRKAAAAAGPAFVAPAATAAKKVRLSWKEQKELETIETAIHAAEAEHARWQAVTEDSKVLADHVRSREAFEKLGAAQHEVERLYARWAELEARA